MSRTMYLAIKRLIDFIISIILLILLLIPFIMISVIIKLEDGGPIFFKQTRVGKNLKQFKIYKFRSMKTEREQLNSNLSHEDMVTKVGKILRKTSIDELPQLINILKGEMSFIGPRPWIPDYYEFFSEEQKKRSDVLPGISGLAQVNGRNQIDIFKKVRYDLEYVENISFCLDLKIIWLTVKSVISRKGAEASEDDIKMEIAQLKKENNTNNS